jgi:hypothetical protein
MIIHHCIAVSTRLLPVLDGIGIIIWDMLRVTLKNMNSVCIEKDVRLTW